MTDATTTTYSVPEISCGHCKETIEGALSGVDGVASAVVDVEAKTVTVDGGDVETVIGAIEDVGFDVDR